MTIAQLESILDIGNGVGESPVWDDATGTLLWVDITARAVLRHVPGARTPARWDMPDFPTFIVLRRNGGAVLGLRDRLCFLDLATGALTPFCQPESDRPANRSNEGGVDPRGCLWFGTMQDNLNPDGTPRAMTASTGALYRVTPDGRSRLVLDGVGLSNTLAWTPDGGTMLFGDTLTNRIQRHRLDPDGTILASEDFHGAPPAGACDGSALDARGYLWNVRFGAGRLVRFAPDGQVDAEIALPVTNPTSCCFGGPGLRTLYLTSARFGLTSEQITANPHEGALVALSVGVPGLPANRFAG